MAESLWNQLGQGKWEAVSAGSKPSGYVHPLAIKAMESIGVDISTARSKHVDEFGDKPFDLVVTVCDNAKESCPFFPNAKRTLHWPFEDPAEFEGSDEERQAGFARVRDEISARISKYLNEEQN
jgi:arsenate reductase